MSVAAYMRFFDLQVESNSLGVINLLKEGYTSLHGTCHMCCRKSISFECAVTFFASFKYPSNNIAVLEKKLTY